MAYQAFYNKYRPQTFDEVVGQKAIVATLKNAIQEDKIAHAYLFCGPRGTGKTTMARLFAKALDCKEGIGKQCNQCDSCLAIAKGEHPDVIEIDAASNSTVDSVRELIDNVSYQPILSRYKVYIIDEVHNMSNSAFNALLKTLEEPPSFVVFILATTEPQKIIPTILSRVQRFDFSKVSDEDLISNMKRVLTSEKIDYEEEALKRIAALSDGGVRDSLSLLDQLVSYSGSKVTADDVDQLFGLLGLKDELSLVRMIEDRKADEALKLIQDKYQKGMDLLRLHSDLIGIYKDLVIYETTQDKNLLERLSEEEAKSFSLSLATTRRHITSLIESKRDYKTADDLLSHFELSILALMEEEPVNAPLPAKEEKAALKPVSEEKVLASHPIEVKTGKEEGFQAAPAIKEEKKDEKIGYSTEEIVNLMLRATKEERVEVAKKWDSLESFFTTDKAFEARALSGMKLRLVADDILLVTSTLIAEVAKINTKKEAPTLSVIAKDAFGKEYRILPILDTEFKDALTAYKAGTNPAVHTPNIDFGIDQKISASTEFMQSLYNDKQ